MPAVLDARTLRYAWATPARWKDVEALFGERGACGGCWCMAWRLERKAFEAGKPSGNRRAFRRLVTGGARPGVIAYNGREPVGWCAIAPRRDYAYLARSRVLAPVDEAPVWSVSCLFLAKPYRRHGISTHLVRVAAEMSFRRGARVVEAYPQAPTMEKTPDAWLWTGLPSAFRRAGFRQVARRSRTRPILRLARSDRARTR